MNTTEIMMQVVGWMGMALILAGVRFQKREQRQLIMSSGASLLAIMASYPEMKHVFFSLQLAVAIVGFMNMKDGREKTKLFVIFTGAFAGSAFALYESVGIDSWIGILGLTGIALGYGAKPETEGGYQFLWMGIGAIGMIGYSLFGVVAGVWQAWPFLVLNIPFGWLGFAKHWAAKKECLSL